MKTINPSSRFYRLLTILRSFKALYRLPPQQVDAFIESYDIYECDWVNGKAVKETEEVAYPKVKQSLIEWYGVLNHLCAIGEVEKMYIPPVVDATASVIKNQTLFEEKFCRLLDMKENDQVFETGCGKGRVAAHLASLSGACITGINIDPVQLKSATAFAEQNRLSDQCHFLNADFNDLPFPFPDNHFDCMYEIQALSLCRDLEKLFHELHRILKPGAKLSLLEWVRLPAYDPDNPHHAELMKLIKPLIGAIGTPTPADYEATLEKAGFEVLLSEDPGSQIPLINQSGKNLNKFMPLIKLLVKIKLVPKHMILLIDRFGKNVEALCEADRLGLITMSYHFIARKPL